jgi:hypothetical protein
MSLESLIFDALKGLVSNRVYPDLAPEGEPPPYIVYQQVGGNPTNFTEGTSPALKNGRVQVAVWSTTRVQASTLMDQAAAALRATTALNTTVLYEKVSDYDSDTKLRGARQDFSFWT